MSKFLSMKVALIFVVAYALAIATATFIENSYSHAIAGNYIYDTAWFWILQGVLAFYLLIAIFKAKMYRVKKFGLLAFHLSFLIILVGAFISKNYAYKADLYVTKGVSRNIMLTGDYFMSLRVTKNGKTTEYSKKCVDGAFDDTFNLDGRPFKLKGLLSFPNAKVEVLKQRSHNQLNFLTGAMSFEIIRNNVKREKYYLEDLGEIEFDEFDLLFNMEPKNQTKPYFKIVAMDQKSQNFKSNVVVHSNFGEEYNATKVHKFSQGILYYITDDIGILAGEATTIGRIVAIPQEKKSKFTNSAMTALVEYDGKKKEIVLIEHEKYFGGFTKELWLDKDTKVEIKWAKKMLTLPFDVYLNDFEVKYYPGSQNVENYFSDITIKDKGKKINAKIRINKPFTYNGYRFFQKKFANSNSTMYSVNYNPGVKIIYFGYMLLAFGLVLNLFRRRV